MNLFSKNREENELYSLDEHVPARGRAGRLRRVWELMQEQEFAQGSLLQRAADWTDASLVRRCLVALLMLVLVAVTLAVVLAFSAVVGGGAAGQDVIIRPAASGLSRAIWGQV